MKRGAGWVWGQPCRCHPPAVAATRPLSPGCGRDTHLGCLIVPVEGGLVIAEDKDVTLDLRLCEERGHRGRILGGGVTRATPSLPLSPASPSRWYCWMCLP